MIQEIKARILAGGDLTEDEALELLIRGDRAELYEAAHEVTEHICLLISVMCIVAAVLLSAIGCSKAED